MKVVALNGSPRLIGNTSTAINILFDELEKEGIETEHLQVYQSSIIPCNDCGSCGIRGDGRCINENDDVNMYLEKLMEADGIVLASPVYYGSMTSQLKMILERIGYASQTSGNQLKRKVGAVITVQSRNGGDSVYHELTNFLLQNQMVVCASSQLTILNGEKPSAIMDDKQGIKALKDLGTEMAWLLSRVSGQ